MREKDKVPNILQAQSILNGYIGQQRMGGVKLPCPRCGKDRMKSDLSQNCYSHHESVYICPKCGLNEEFRMAMRQAPLPVTEWAIMKGFRG